MKETLIQKYKPKTLDNFFLNKKDITFFNRIIDFDLLSMLIIGNNGSGKTTILNILLNKYYKNDVKPENVLYINNLQEKSISFYKNEIKTFCNNIKSKVKKTLVIDDIDFLNEKKQHIFRYYIDNYQYKINFLFTCTNTQNVIECIQSRLLMYTLPRIEKKHLIKIYNNIKKNENIQITKSTENILFKNINNSVNELINYTEKILLFNEKIDNKLLKRICTNLSFSSFKKYTTEWYIKKDFNKSINILLNIYNKGYSIIDIYQFYYDYIKNCEFVKTEHKFEIIKIISNYINIFYTLYEKKIELYFFTNDLINLK